MDGVLQKSMDMSIELISTAKSSSRQGGVVMATLRAERVSSIPVDQDNKNNNSLHLAGECAVGLRIGFTHGIFYECMFFCVYRSRQ